MSTIIRQADVCPDKGVQFSVTAFDGDRIIFGMTVPTPVSIDDIEAKVHITAKKARALAAALLECADAIDLHVAMHGSAP